MVIFYYIKGRLENNWVNTKSIINKFKKENITLSEYKRLRNEIKDDFVYYSLFEYIYEKSHKIKEYNRESSGAIYTPYNIVKMMVDNALDKIDKDLWNAKILEPSSGSGNFVQVLFESILARLKKAYPEKQENEIKTHIAENIIYISEFNPYALITSAYRIYDLYGVLLKNTYLGNSLLWLNEELIDKKPDKYYQLNKVIINMGDNDLEGCLKNAKNIITKFDFNKEKFDLVIGNPPYGNILNPEFKKSLADGYSNIALSFFDMGFNLLNESGVLSYIAPHSFSRANGNKKWRKKIYDNKSLNELIDCGNPFYDITLETVIYVLTKEENESVKLSSLKDKGYAYTADYEKLFYKDTYRFIMYYDDEYERIQSLPNLTYPFGGKRGKDMNKKDLLLMPDKNSLWVILGKNISKNGLININNYDRYIDSDSVDEKYILKNDSLAITQFGTNLKAVILRESHYPSGGVVLVTHDGLSMSDAKDYLNQEYINYYLKRYILNNADLTVHLDGIYLKEIPYSII